ncbi:hypothetical protein DB88DRAFT_478509 [Papiliotrema laurentii]|uniref:mRNA stability protein n=1 Tax=Papiliotrema laurentii TaxID=5418 RepID=A0AAD9FWI6_PAPLA|nr:hypothetical protein DB88DRAFT_478509 [Papiliotrema laurentii]
MIQQLNEEQQKAFKLYGKLPAKNALTKMQKDRKYFDSGDYMMKKAGVKDAQVGTAIPTPEGVPHASPPGPNSPGGFLSTSPTANVSPPLYAPGSAIVDDSAPSEHAHAQPIGVPGQHQSTGFPGQLHPFGATGQPQPIGVPGQPQPFHPHHRGSVGVGISPAGNDSFESSHINHFRRQSESHRISPPGTLRDANIPSSSFPIQHHGNSYGSSPVKASSLARRLDEEIEG